MELRNRNLLTSLQGDEVKFRAEYSIPSHHIFAANEKEFKCEEVLYVSDTARESHYWRKHSKNKGKLSSSSKHP
jgi:hypothetical protein